MREVEGGAEEAMEIRFGVSVVRGEVVTAEVDERERDEKQKSQHDSV